MKISLSLQVNENSFSNQRFRTEPRFETEANDPFLSTAKVVHGLSQPTKNILYALSFVTHLLRPVSIKFDFSMTSETRSCHCGVQHGKFTVLYGSGTTWFQTLCDCHCRCAELDSCNYKYVLCWTYF